MLKPAEFVALWGEELVRLPPDGVNDIDLPQDTLRFLTVAGLPRDCAPCLSFAHLARTLKNIPDTYVQRKNLQSLAPLFVIGSDGSGNPICLDTAHGGRVILADHESWLQPVQYVNASVVQLAECLLAYRDMVYASFAQNGEDAMLDDNILAPALEQARARMASADTEALQEGNFWYWELNSLGQQ